MSQSTEQVELRMPEIPHGIFEKDKDAPLLGETQPVYFIESMVAVEHQGFLIKYVNVPYLRKGAQLCKNPLFLLGVVTSKTRVCRSFNVIFNKIFGTHKIKDEFMCRAAFNLANFVHGVLVDVGIETTTAKTFAFNVAQILQFDDAYRYRFQDIVTELSLENLEKHPKKEVKRLIKLFKARTTDFVYLKIDAILFIVMVFFPFFKKSFIKHAKFLKEAKLDEHDRYWVCMRDDHYNYLGLSVEERHELYTERPITYQVTV